MKKIIIALVSVLIILCLASCNTDKTDYTFENLNEEFVLLSEAYVPSTLPAPYKAGEGTYEKITGKGILAQDKESDIELVSIDGMSVTLTVDEKQVVFYAEGLEGAQIVDIDQNDDMNELAVFSAGPSMDPTVHFFRYNGEKLYAIPFIRDIITSYVPYDMYGYHAGDAEHVLPTYGAIWTNRNGKILSSMQYTGFSDPRFALAYYELKDDQFMEKVLNEGNLPLPAEVKARDEIQVFFTPMDKAPETFEDPTLFNNFENPRVIHKDEAFKILSFGKCYNYYAFFVELNGERGVITFWTGD